MISGSWYDSPEQRKVIETRLNEMRAQAEHYRLVRRLRRPGLLRRWTGDVLIGLGRAVGGRCPEVTVETPARAPRLSAVQRG